MLSGTMAHYFRHAILAYGRSGQKLGQKLLISRELCSLEAKCLKLLQQNPNQPKITALLERVRSVKAKLTNPCP